MIQKIINFDDVTKKYIKEYNPNWPQIPDHPYKILNTSLVFIPQWHFKVLKDIRLSFQKEYKNII